MWILNFIVTLVSDGNRRILTALGLFCLKSLGIFLLFIISMMKIPKKQLILQYNPGFRRTYPPALINAFSKQCHHTHGSFYSYDGINILQYYVTFLSATSQFRRMDNVKRIDSRLLQYLPNGFKLSFFAL